MVRHSVSVSFQNALPNGGWFSGLKPIESKGMDYGLGQTVRMARKLEEECPYQVVLARRQLTDDSAILDFLLANVGWFDMYVEDEYAAYVLLLRRPARRRNFPLPF